MGEGGLSVGGEWAGQGRAMEEKWEKNVIEQQ